MKFLRMLGRTFIESFKNIFRQRWLSFSSIISITLTLILTASSLILSINTKRITEVLAQGLTVHVYINKDVSRESVSDMINYINTTKNVKNSEFSSKEKQLDLVLENYNESHRNILEEYKQYNPLNDVIIVTLHDPKFFPEFRHTISNRFVDTISSIEYEEKIANTILPLLDRINKYMFFLIIAVAFVSLILIMNTIRVTILARKTDIIIMRLVAASNWYIRLPFIIEGMLLGLISSLIASLIVLGVYSYFYPIIYSSFVYGNENVLVVPALLYREVLLTTSSIGLIIGFIGSIFPVRKYLKR